ncbi:MAG: EFR1 family ferrodoxin [Chloroflexi bacterium]|nr:EFR1 family ferrodoxin [Chloroflexota bacterium]MBU1751677.1 EFR1 family ferrodoxin [Chloroflexota bacterium]
MKGLICYYSGSGNTRLACRYIAAHVEQAEVDLLDIAKGQAANLVPYDMVGFAAFTDFWGPSALFLRFVEGLPGQENKLAFVFNTYGFVSGKTLRVMERAVSAQGFRVVMGHSLHTPESYPPMIVGGRGNEDAPNDKEMRAFAAFIAELDRVLEEAAAGGEVKKRGVPIGLLNRLLPVPARTRARAGMGVKYVDEALCTECGVCARVCPYEAIELSPKPVVDMTRCYGCWACYNRCPEKAIYTAKYRGIGHYPKPDERLRAKLGV